jgi:argininosuccinate synthase
MEVMYMKEKVILAYSGGLDTTAIIPWLKENYDYEVVCVCIDVGQGNELDGLEERAKLSGATKLYIEDVVDEFVNNYVMPCVKANAVYENKYLLGTSMAQTRNCQKTGGDCKKRRCYRHLPRCHRQGQRSGSF